MVTVVFYNLLRSKYRIQEIQTKSGSIHHIIEDILEQIPAMSHDDFKNAVVFIKEKPYHFPQFDTVVEDGERIVITHFVGGG